MDRMIVQPPFDSAWLHELAAALHHEGWADASGTVAWLDEHRAAQQMVSCIRTAWGETSLPLREWANRIENVALAASEKEIMLAVHLVGAADKPILQSAPFTPHRLRGYTKAFPAALPSLLEQLALSAPGLSLDGSSALAEPRYFMDRLGYIRRWLRNVKREDVLRLGYEYLDPQRHLLEAAHNGQGDCYVIGADESLSFFNHEANGLVRCSVTWPDFLNAYFKCPDDILDPFANGWASEPCEQKGSLEVAETPFQIQAELTAHLSHLAGIALAVRGCERAMPEHCLGRLPDKWRKDRAELQDILMQCRQVAITGKPLSPEYSHQSAELAKRAGLRWKRIAEGLKTNYSCDILSHYALPALVRACSDIGNPAAVGEAVAYGSDVSVLRGEDRDESTQAAIAEAKYLLSLNLGDANTVGSPVPASFFDLPLWSGDKKER